MSRILRSSDTNPYRNLAREEALLLHCATEPILYLWQNAATVVIGRNQNPWRECQTSLLQAEGGTLARRTTGGGAVFHDMGNLNFSFILPRAQYDLTRQLAVIMEAVRTFSIPCAFSGRNDILADGRKFSGNAFRFTKEGGLHHGTLMVAVDPERMARYLQVSKQKLAARGVASVSSRVVNLSALGEVTIDSLAHAVAEAFATAYGPAPLEDGDALTLPGYDALYARNATWAWNYGAAPAFDVMLDTRFDWGGIELHLSLKEGRVSACKVFTDAMDGELAGQVESALLGCPYEAKALGEKVGGPVGDWLSGLSL